MTIDYLELISDTNFTLKIGHSFDVLEQCLKIYKPNQIAVAFNGGKDCTVVLHQYSMIFQKYYSNKIRAIFIHNKPQFESVNIFIDECISRYNLDLIRINGRIKDSLEELKFSHPDIECIIMGSRLTDPYMETLKDFSPTDPTWPTYMRCNPILNYSYKDIWTFFEHFKVSYCPIYDQGFTSLGDKELTNKNIKLQYQNIHTGALEYKPAYMLDDEISERDGRDSNQKH